MQLQQILVNHLFDIIIAVFSLAVIISSFFKPTFRYIRWLVGLIVAGLSVIVLKAVNFFNFIESYASNLLARLQFRKVTDGILKLFGKEYISVEKADVFYNLSVLLVIGLVVFIIVNLIMGISHSIKVKRENRKGNYVYNNPIASFIFSLIFVVIGICTITLTCAALPFDIDYVNQSFIMRNTYKVIETIFNFVRGFIPSLLPLGDYLKKIAGVTVGAY